jgi:hypothetical protein
MGFPWHTDFHGQSSAEPGAIILNAARDSQRIDDESFVCATFAENSGKLTLNLVVAYTGQRLSALNRTRSRRPCISLAAPVQSLWTWSAGSFRSREVRLRQWFCWS